MEQEAALREAAQDLYGLLPDRFTAARDERVAAARRAGDEELARTVKTWRRPSAAAWAVNSLVRSRPEEIRRLSELGQALRQAQAELSGEDLRVLGGRRQQIVHGLAREAAVLAADAGLELSENVMSQVQATFDAALADAQAAAAVASGRLTRALENTGMGQVDLGEAVGGPPPETDPTPNTGSGPQQEEVRAEIEAAARVVAEEEDAVRRAEEKAARRHQDLEETTYRRRQAWERVVAAEASLAVAKAAAQEAADAEDRASERDEAARRGLELARRRLDRAESRLTELRGGVATPDPG